ncbi:MAG TPA: hypothetical protein PLM53_02415 [Spirochaetota bacterium]|nr:hypothetical protein [Spirochaetota bacterium]HPC41730.1 hypothetical protein [Spirochaetota bacterium]HPL18604.1 hypothetical protein [Spirochaetota bacterium]HQF06671.1 hypothetical protein [Spirochaetota bacterium]HQH95926.1 hypothetical protein [Spirochaetota bacterium]
MKKMLVFTAILLVSAGACRKGAGEIPSGTWNYRLMVNGAPIGRAVVTNRIVNNTWVSTTDMEMDAGYIKNTSRQVITETLDFKPVKMETHNRTIQNGQVSEVKTIATFTGNTVALETGEGKSTITVTKPFILEGNYFMNELIRNEFKPGTIIRNHIYEPSVDTEEPVLVLVKVLGREDVSINGKTKNLIHLGFSIENLKNIDSYIDNDGITQKTVITMLNNRLELVLE